MTSDGFMHVCEGFIRLQKIQKRMYVFKLKWSILHSLVYILSFNLILSCFGIKILYKHCIYRSAQSLYNVVRSLHNTYTSNKEYKERERGGGKKMDLKKV